MATQPLNNLQHDAVLNSPVGRYLDRLVRADVARGGEPHGADGGNIIQQLWEAFHPETPKGKTS